MLMEPDLELEGDGTEKERATATASAATGREEQASVLERHKSELKDLRCKLGPR